jgi:selenide,water dikinase
MGEVGVSAATDVTGFGLLGHLAEVCAASGVGAFLKGTKVPVLPGAGDLLDAGFFPGGSERNLAAVRGMLAGSAAERTLRMLADAQTSGGLLMAVTSDRAPSLFEALASAGVSAAAIGAVTSAVGQIDVG